MKTQKDIKILCTLCLWLGWASLAPAQNIDWKVLSNGGITTSDSIHILKSTVGQPAIGKVQDASIQHGAGFWYTTANLVTGIETVSGEPVPKTFRLDQNYPNPFNPVTTISFAIAKRTHVLLVLYDILGRQMITLVDETLGPGEYKVQLAADALSSGVYFYSMRAGEFRRTRKLTVLK
jgi:hypothetical protein